jgi:phospholipid/cholesterol/gamma-HCH transport system permease protein
MINGPARALRGVAQGVARVGYGTRFFLRLCGLALAGLRRPRLVIDQIHFIGNHSLSIILVSGLLIGFVLGLQGYYTLRRYGSEEALGLLVTLSLVRELGPVVTALLFAGRAGTSLTAEVGLMKAGEQIDATDIAKDGPEDSKQSHPPCVFAGTASVALPVITSEPAGIVIQRNAAVTTFHSVRPGRGIAAPPPPSTGPPPAI